MNNVKKTSTFLEVAIRRKGIRFFYIFLSVLILFIVSCGPPSWVYKGSGAYNVGKGRVFYGVGKAKGIKNQALLKATADNRARREVSMIKVAVVRMHQKIADRAIQVFGAMGMTDDTPIASSFVSARGLRIGDGPDEVHLRQIFRLEPPPQHTIAESPYMFPFDPDGDDVSS